MKSKDIELIETCGACPESYNAFYNNTYVGFLRLRHGYFHVSDVDEKTVYEAYPKGDGIFNCEERDYYLKKARKAIKKAFLQKLDNENSK